MTTMSDQERVKEVIVESRIAKVLALRTDSIVMLEALDAISEFYTNNDVESRKNLRRNLELQNVEYGKKFLEAMAGIKGRMEAAEVLSNNLRDACNTLAVRVKEADQNMKSFVEKASQLESDRSVLLQQSKEVKDFISQFHLSDQEVELLTTSNLDISVQARAFFAVLSKVKAAYSDCKVLAQNQGYSVGFELLEMLGKHQDTAYMLLYNWVKQKCDYLSESGSTDDIDVNSRLQLAIVYLKEVPLYYSQCQELLIQARRAQLLQRFMLVLTQGESGNNKFNRALDLQAHDGVAYVGGMLAFVHQSVAAEREFIEAIFGGATNMSSHPASTTTTTTSSSSSSNNNNAGSSSAGGSHVSKGPGLSNDELLGRTVVSLGKPLRVRIMQTLENRCNVEILYALADLMTFYLTTFEKIISLENAIHSTVKGCLLECKKLFVRGLSQQGEALKQNPISFPLDLKVAVVTKDFIFQISAILKVYNSALSQVLHDPEDSLFIDNVLGDIISQVLQSCRLGSQHLQPAEMATYMMNNITAIQHEVREAMVESRKTAWEELLASEAESWVGILVHEEVLRFLRRSDLEKLAELVDVLPSGLKASEQIGLSPDRVGTVMRAFYSSLYSSVPAQFEKLQDPAIREVIRAKVAEEIAAVHSKVYQMISTESNGYDASLLAHTPQEVLVLLGGSAP